MALPHSPPPRPKLPCLLGGAHLFFLVGAVDCAVPSGQLVPLVLWPLLVNPSTPGRACQQGNLQPAETLLRVKAPYALVLKCNQRGSLPAGHKETVSTVWCPSNMDTYT